jgi:hypothetical protein
VLVPEVKAGETRYRLKVSPASARACAGQPVDDTRAGPYRVAKEFAAIPFRARRIHRARNVNGMQPPRIKRTSTVLDPANPLVQLFNALGEILVLVARWLAAWSLLIVWVVWWLWGVNWRKVWPVLAGGAWAPVVLLLLVGALVWSQIAPTTGLLLGLFPVPS